MYLLLFSICPFCTALGILVGNSRCHVTALRRHLRLELRSMSLSCDRDDIDILYSIRGFNLSHPTSEILLTLSYTMLACKLTHIFETTSFMDVINESPHTFDVPLPRRTNEHTQHSSQCN